MQRPAFVIALTTGALATGLAFFSSAGAEDLRFENPPARVATAIFAGGGFAGVEADFDKVPGVIDTVAGYTGGLVENPSYKEVSRGGTGHYEAVKVSYDPSQVSYDELAEYFVHRIDPTDIGGQFCDQGAAYRSAIFVSGQGERASAETALTEAKDVLGREVATEVLSASTFWRAEDAFQDFHIRNASKFDADAAACGREARLNELWGEPAKAS